MEQTRYPGVHRRSDGRYRIRVKAQDPKTGRTRVYKRVVEARSAAEAAAIREEARKAIETGPDESRPRVRLADAATSWLTGKLPGLKASTSSHYAYVLDSYILPELGDFYLDALTANDVVGWRDGQKGAASTVNSRLRVLKTLLGDLSHRHDLRDPSARVEPHRVRKSRVRKSLTASELALFLYVARQTEPLWHPIFLTLALTGGRFGEVSALLWEHVDFEASVIHLVEAQWHQIVDDTKAGAMVELPLLPELAEVLRQHRQRLVAKQAKGVETGIVFPSPRAGRFLYSSVLSKPIRRVLKAAELDRPFNVHGFRHTFNNLCRQVAGAEVVRSMTGHVTAEMTERYSHIEPEERRAAAEQMLRLVTQARK